MLVYINILITSNIRHIKDFTQLRCSMRKNTYN